MFGFLDVPIPLDDRPRGDGVLADSHAKTSKSVAVESDDESPAPTQPRFGPLSAGQKRKVARRAGKVDRPRDSFAGAAHGVSIGAVLAIALVGWRVYRVVRRVDRMATATGEFIAGSVDDEVGDPTTVATRADKEIEAELRKPGSAEDREWLDPVRHPNHGVLEMGRLAGSRLVEELYELGATKVRVVDPSEIGGIVFTAIFVVELPSDPAQRRQLLELEANISGDDPSPDIGQKYFQIFTD